MVPRDDFDRAGAALRRRAADLARGHDADEVSRLARRRRAWQGSLAGIVALTVVGVAANSLAEAPADRIAIEPLAPSEPAPSVPAPDETEQPEPEDRQGEPAVCDVNELAGELPATLVAGATGAVVPDAAVGAQLLPAGEHVYALSPSAPMMFATFAPTDGWRCLPAPPAPAHGLRVVGLVGGDRVLAVSAEGAALFDPATERWTEVAVPDVGGAEPADGLWDGERYIVLFEGAGSSPVMTFDPAASTWASLPALPVTMTRDTPSNLLWTGSQLLWLGGEPSRDRLVWQAASLLELSPSGDWEARPAPPVSDHHVQAVVLGEQLLAVDDAGDSATFDLETGIWSDPAPSGIDPGSCPPRLVAGTSGALLTACWHTAIYDGGSTAWSPLDVEGSIVTAAAALEDGTALAWHHRDEAGTSLLLIPLDDQDLRTAGAAEACAAVAEFAARLSDPGVTADEAAPRTPQDLADDVDLVVVGTLTGEVEVANGPGPAGESYLAYELAVTEVVAGDARVGDTVRVSIAFDGDPTRSAALTTDVPVGASALVFAYEVTDAPGGWVAADSNGFAVACDGGPPLGQVGEGAAWSDLTDLDALVTAARR